MTTRPPGIVVLKYNSLIVGQIKDWTIRETTETRLKFRPIRSDRLSDKVAEQLLEKIHSGELAPGSRLPSETELADQFEISRGVIREALTILQAQGYIRRRPKGREIGRASCRERV